MIAIVSILLAVASAVLGAAIPETNAASTGVWVRVEGLDMTVFEGFVNTKPKAVTTLSGGSHTCDLTHGAMMVAPVSTVLGALDSAALASGFPFDATYNKTTNDFTVSVLGDTIATATEGWSVLVNSTAVAGSGCKTATQSGDEIVYAIGGSSAAHYLGLVLDSAPTSGVAVGVVGSIGTFTVYDIVTGKVVAGAQLSLVVDGFQSTILGLSDVNGQIALDFWAPSPAYFFKAYLPGSIRSNVIEVFVTL